MPPNGQSTSIAPSLARKKRGVGTNGAHTNGDNKRNGPPYPYDTAPEPENPTVMPEAMLRQYHFTFLIRDPRRSIPSYYRCTIPPLDQVTGFYDFDPSEAGYDELRRVFDYLRHVGQVGPRIAGTSEHAPDTNGHVAGDHVEICVVDADDLLDRPAEVIEKFCRSVGMEYSPDMLNWDNDEDHTHAKDAFEKWKGFHEDAIESRDLKPRAHVRCSDVPEDHYRCDTC